MSNQDQAPLIFHPAILPLPKNTPWTVCHKVLPEIRWADRRTEGRRSRPGNPWQGRKGAAGRNSPHCPL